MPDANFADYVRSLGDELRARASRVRQLIGEAHWGRDGQHKEELLAEFLGRHLPTRYVALPGFVVSADSFPDETSREQDIVIWEAQQFPWLMRANHLAIGFPDACAAVISVKTTVDHAQFMDMWNTIGSIPGPDRERPRIGFVFEEASFPKNIETVYAWFKDAIAATKKVNLNYLGTTGDVFARVDTTGAEARIRIFSSKGASFGLVLGCLLQDLGDRHFDMTVALDALEAKPLGTFQTVSLS